MSKYTIIYFSPTGNVKHLTEMLAGYLGSEKCVIFPLEFTDPKQLDKNEHLILIYPVHGFNSPRLVNNFVRDINPELFDSVSLLSVGCADHWANRAVSQKLRRILLKKNYKIIVDEMLAMPLTFIMAFSDELSLKVIDESEKKIRDIAESIIEGKQSIFKVQFKTRIFNFIGKIESPAGKLFGLELHANKNCISCGTCWENCPSGNIKENSKGKPKFAFKCTMCMRCIYSCPENAISPRFSKFIPIKGGYSLKKFRKS